MSIKSTIAAIAASPFLLAGAAFAGPYVNVESNLSYPDGEYSATATEVHIGFEGGEGAVAYYIQGGPALNHADATDDTETHGETASTGSTGVKKDMGTVNLITFRELFGRSGLGYLLTLHTL